MARILVVEDDDVLREGIVYNLTKQEYTVESAVNGNLAIEVARKIQPDLIILDIMLPGMDGLQVCRILRQEMSCPILMLTARAEEIDRVIGLEIGADDYITKPFSMRELLARVKAHLRHERMVLSKQGSETKPVMNEEVLTSNNLILDLGRREVSLNGQPLQLKPKEFNLLHYLMRNQGKTLSRAILLEKIWEWNYFTDTHTVDVHVHWLREMIEEDPKQPKRIVTVRGSGYRFEG